MRLALLLALTAGTAQADTLPGSVDWLIAQSGEPRHALHLGAYDLDGRGVVAMDPLTLYASDPTPDLPRLPAQVYVIQRDDGEWRTNAAMMLVLSDTAPSCGAAVSGFGVDTGLAAMTSAHDHRQLEIYADILNNLGQDLYTALESQLTDSTVAGFVTLPDGTRIPIASSGYGDGGYNLYRLDGPNGEPVAVYVDFLGGHDDAWIEPAPCASV